MASTPHALPASQQQQPPAPFLRDKHVKYWTRCLKTLLPEPYTSNDSNRMYLAYFMLSALDLLGSLETITTPAERADYAAWIYRCQHPDGGFRMWPGTDFGALTTARNRKWDPANVPATYFALCSLLALGDDFERLDRRGALAWLARMQRADGSFGETFVGGRVEGGRDPRFGYCAAGIRYMLRNQTGGRIEVGGEWVADVDVDAVVSCVRAAEAYEGGIADEPFHEPHAGYTFCSLGVLAFLGRLNTAETKDDGLIRGPSDPEALLRWLLALQTDVLEPDAELDSEFSGVSVSDPKPSPAPAPAPPNGGSSGSSHQPLDPSPPIHQSPDKSTMWSASHPSASGLNALLASPSSSAAASPSTLHAPPISGFGGRLNKAADTCYAFWVLGSLHTLDRARLAETESLQRYLLAHTQHPYMGGFGKFPSDRADLYHSYLGLAALSLCGSEAERGAWGLKALDAGMCVSVEARGRLEGLWRRWGV